jgi:glutamine synthetase
MLPDLVAGLHDTIGEPLLTAYTTVKRHEAEHFRNATLATERQTLWHRY